MRERHAAAGAERRARLVDFRGALRADAIEVAAAAGTVDRIERGTRDQRDQVGAQESSRIAASSVASSSGVASSGTAVVAEVARVAGRFHRCRITASTMAPIESATPGRTYPTMLKPTFFGAMS